MAGLYGLLILVAVLGVSRVKYYYDNFTKQDCYITKEHVPLTAALETAEAH